MLPPLREGGREGGLTGAHRSLASQPSPLDEQNRAVMLPPSRNLRIGRVPMLTARGASARAGGGQALTPRYATAHVPENHRSMCAPRGQAFLLSIKLSEESNTLLRT